MNRLRATELAAHTASYAAVVATIFVVSIVPGAEANPFSAAIIDALGLLGWALATPLAVACWFAILRWARARTPADDRVQPRHFGAVFVLGLALDAFGNGYAIATHATAWSVNWETLALEAGAVAVLALAMVVRPAPRALASGLFAAVRGLSSQLTSSNLSAARSVLLAGMLVLAAISGYGLVETIQPVSAHEHSDGDNIIDDFESGSLTDWTLDTGGSEVNKQAAIVGTYGLEAGCCGLNENDAIELPLSGKTPSSVSFRANIPSYDTDGDGYFPEFRIYGSSSNTEAVSINESGAIISTNDGYTGIDVQEGTDYKFRWKNINYGTDATLVVEGGGTTQTSTVTFDATDLDKIRIIYDDKPWYVDYIVKNGATPSNTVSGTVRDQNGDPVGDATVIATKYEYNNFSGTAEEVNESIADIQAQLEDPVPDAYEEQTELTSASDYTEAFEGDYVAVHQASDWDFASGVDPIGGDPSPIGGDDQELVNTDEPNIVVPENDPPILTLWTRGDEALFENEADAGMPGKTKRDGGNITVARLGPGGSEIWERTFQTQDFAYTVNAADLGSGPLGRRTHEAVVLEGASAGFYRAHPEEEPEKAITFAVAPNADIDDLKGQIRDELKDENETLTERAQYLADKQSNNKLGVERITTGEDGDFTLDTDADKVTFSALKGPDGIETDAQNLSSQAVRDYFNETVRDLSEDDLTGTGALNQSCQAAFEQIGAAYTQDGTTTVTVPESGVTVDVQRVGAPPEADLETRSCRETAKTEDLFADALGEITSGLTNAYQWTEEQAEEFVEIGTNPATENPEVCQNAIDILGVDSDGECTAGDDGGPGDIDGDGYIGGNESDPGLPDGPVESCPVSRPECGAPPESDYTPDEAEDVANAADQAVDDTQDTVESSVDETETAINETTGNGTVSAEFSFEADLSDKAVTVTIQPDTGEPIILNESSPYVTVEERFAQPDLVKVEGYPLENGTAVADVQATIADAEDVASASTTVRNPTFDGDRPAIEAIRVSSSQPGPGDRVVVEPQGADSTYGGLTHAQAVAPNGTNLTTTVTDGQAEFDAVGEGTHIVRLTMTNAAGRNFTTSVRVAGQGRTIDRPPTVRTRTGPLGRLAIASDGLQSARVDVTDDGREAMLAAVIPSDADVPPRVHAHEQSLDLEPSHTTTVRILRAPDEQAVSQRSTIVLHSASVTDDAIVYANGQPLERDGSNEYGSTNYSDSGLNVEAISDASGTARIKVINDPGLVQWAVYFARANAPFLFTSTGGLTGMAVGGGLSAGLLTSAGAAWALGRRSRGGAA